MGRAEGIGMNLRRSVIRPRLARRVWEEQGGCCAACGDPFPSFQLHHILPAVFGGTNEHANLAGLCDQCHALAPNDPAEFEAFCGSLGRLGVWLQAARRVWRSGLRW